MAPLPASATRAGCATRAPVAMLTSSRQHRPTEAAKRHAVAPQAVKDAAPLAAITTLVATQAHAATEVATVAADSRVGILASLFLPVVGWVLFNIGSPAFNQLRAMQRGERLGPGGEELKRAQSGQNLSSFSGERKKFSKAPKSEKKKMGKSRVPQKVGLSGLLGKN